MRQLTQQEIDQAPEWATHYVIPAGIEAIRWRDSKHFQWSDCDCKQNLGGWSILECQPIPRKEFDISAYEFSDLEIERAIQHDSDEVQLDMMDGSRPALINKRDAIALAKHFKLTSEDLK